MDTLTLGAVAGLAVTFLIVGLWQRRLARDSDRENRALQKDAKARGKDKALAQYPQIREDLCLGCGSCIAACPEDGVIGLVAGVACIIHGARCVGHGKCAEACPVSAITVGLGDVSQRPDIPVLSPALETNIPGLYIAGELGGIALVRNAVEQGRRAVDDIARRLRSEPAANPPGVLDLLVVGSGPAGLASVFRAVELKLDYALVSLEDVGGTVRKYPRRKLTLVQAVDIPLQGRLKEAEYEKETLLKMWSEVIAKHGIRCRTGAGLTGVTRRDGFLEVETTLGTIRARFVVLALGRRGSPRKLGVPGEESERVLYELEDAATLKGQRILVVGGGDSAVEAALGLAAQAGNQVSLSYRKPEFFRLKSRNEERLRAAVEAGRLRVMLSTEVRAVAPGAVTLAGPGGGETLLPNDWVFVFVGGDPPFPLLQKIGVRFGVAPVKAARV
ncbi:MAG: NAD(P)-binding domain-containing protein [Elusimicrobia bacterium]|nr:NAD(P)-binding domain-containing protein [Elusimicrobiota bacterium]